MKKAATLLVLAITLAACHSRYQQDNDSEGHITRKTTEKTPFNDLDLEMRGNLSFNDQGTAITAIPQDGYVKYSRNGMRLEARPGKNKEVAITIYDHGTEIPAGSKKGKEILSEAIGRMQDIQEKYN